MSRALSANGGIALPIIGLLDSTESRRGKQEATLQSGDEQRILALLIPTAAGLRPLDGPLLVAIALQDVTSICLALSAQHNVDLAARKSWCEAVTL